jgi:hypothetical protein
MKSVGINRKQAPKNKKTLKILVQNEKNKLEKRKKKTKNFGTKRKKTSSKHEKNENGFSISKQKPILNLEKHKKMCLNKRGLFFPLGKIDIVP